MEPSQTRACCPQGQARTTCQKWRALLGLAACDLMLSADTSMARRLTQGTALSKRGRPRAPRASGQPLRSSMLPRRFRVWHTRETSPHTDVCNRSTVTAKGRLQQSFFRYIEVCTHTTPMTLPPSPRHEEGRPTTRARPHALTRAEGLLDGRPTSATNTQNRYSDRVHTDRPDRVCFCRSRRGTSDGSDGGVIA